MSLTAHRAINRCLDKLVAHALELCLIVVQVMTARLGDDDHLISGVLHRRGDGHDGTDSVASRRQGDCAVLLDFQRDAERPYDMRQSIRRLQQDELAAGLALLQHHEGDCTLLGIPVAQGVGHALGSFVNHHDNKLTSASLPCHLRRDDNDFVNVRGDFLFFQDLKCPFASIHRLIKNTRLVDRQLSQRTYFFVDMMPPKVRPSKIEIRCRGGGLPTLDPQFGV